MALQGTFVADFAAFTAACAGAEVSLQGFETGAAKVESQMNRVSDSLSGTKIVQQATMAAEAVKRLGGDSGITGGLLRLTDQELARVGATATEAVAKLRALGEDVPPELQTLANAVTPLAPAVRSVGAAATDAAPAVGTLQGSLKGFDGILASMGVRIGPQIQAIGEIGSASGKTAAQLGGVATAGLIAGAAIAGIKAGRLIADFLGTDVAIGNATAKLLGWGDVAAATAGAKTDVLARASAAAGRDITTMAEAIKINTEAAKTAANTYSDFGARMDVAQAAVAALTQADVDLITTAIKLGATTAEITHNFELSADAQKILTEELAAGTKAETEAAEAAQKLADATTEMKSSGDGWRGTLAGMNQSMIDAIAGYLEAGVSQASLATFYGLTATQIKAVGSALKEEEEIRKITDRSIVETMKLQAEYSAMLVEQGGTDLQVRIAHIEEWAAVEVAKLKEGDANWQAHYDQIQANAAKMRDGVMLNWDDIGDNSRQQLEDTRDTALREYEYVSSATGQFSAATIAKYRETYFAARDAAMDWRSAGVAANDAVGASVDVVTDKYRTLSGELISMEERSKRQLQGGSSDITAGNLFSVGAAHGMSEAEMLKMAKRGFSFQEMLQAFRAGMVDTWVPQGPRIPGFMDGVTNFGGGLARVHQDELLVNLPAGTSVIPRGGSAAGSVINQYNTINVNATAEDAVRKIKHFIMQDLKSAHQF